MKFHHRIDYRSILYAEEDIVIAQNADILAIDVLKLDGDRLLRIKNVPLTPSFIPETLTSAFLPEENQFVFVANRSLRCELWRLDWNEQAKRILNIKGFNPLLRFPLS